MQKENIYNYWWLRPPDFEVRCDAFVNEVIRRVIPKYPKLQIEVENYTREELTRLPRVLDIAREFRNRDRLLERIKSEDRWKEELSATENLAAIDMTGEGENSFTLMAKAFEDIEAIAKIHGGRRLEIPGYSIDADLGDPDYPGIFLRYIFS